MSELLGNDLYDVSGHEKATLRGLIVDGGLEPCRTWSEKFRQAFAMEVEQ